MPRCEEIEYEELRTGRRTVAIRVLPDGTVRLYLPRRFPAREAEAILAGKLDWIRSVREKAFADRAAAGPVLTEAELEELRRRGRRVFPEKAACWAKRIGVDYGRITIRCQRTRWGSCSARGDLSFNCLLLLLPEGALDAIVVHELCHRLYMDHSPAFYEAVLRAYPDYKMWERVLLNEGGRLLLRLPTKREQA